MAFGAKAWLKAGCWGILVRCQVLEKVKVILLGGMELEDP